MMDVRNRPIMRIPIKKNKHDYDAYITGIYSNNESETIDISYYVPDANFDNSEYMKLDNLLIDKISAILAKLDSGLSVNSIELE